MQTSKVTPTTPSQAEIETWLWRQVEDFESNPIHSRAIGVQDNAVVMIYYHNPKPFKHVFGYLTPYAAKSGTHPRTIRRFARQIRQYLMEYPRCQLQK